MNQQYDQGYFSCNLARDRCICVIALVLTFYILYCYYMQNVKEGLDNRPRWMLGGLRDDTGAVNSKGLFGMGFGVDQSRTGAATNAEGVQFAFGQSSIEAGGFKQSEYANLLGAKEGLDYKAEKLSEKTTESNLQAKLFGQ